MKKIGKKIFIVSALCMALFGAFAETGTALDIAGPGTSANTGADINIKAVRCTDGEEEIIYIGPFSEYDGGKWSGFDFSGVQVLEITNWDDMEESIRIVPLNDTVISENTSVSEVQTQTETLETNSTSNIAISSNVSLIYDNSYYENVLLPDKSLTVSVSITNTGTSERKFNSYIAQYTLDGVFKGVKKGETITVPGGQTVTGTVSDNFSVDGVSTARVFLWERGTISPARSSIVMHTTPQDYYSDSFAEAQAIALDKDVCGIINTADDADIIKFTPDLNGVYALRLSGADVTAELCNSSNQTLGAISQTGEYLLYSLEANKDYYLKMTGNADSAYTVKPVPHSSFEAILKNAAKPGNIGSAADYDMYSFTPSESGTYIITAVGTDKVQARLYDENCSLISSAQTADNDVSFRISKDLEANKQYYIAVYSKDGQTGGAYTLYAEEPFDVISIQQGGF